MKRRLARLLRKLVPWTDGQTIVAAIDAIAHRAAELVRDMPLMLDGEIGDAARRIELIGLREGIGRADILTGPAGTAAVLMRRIGLQRLRGEYGAEKKPRAKLARNEIGVFALPAKPCGLGEGLFHHRRGVDENLHLHGRLFRQPARNPLEPFLDEVVIVAVLRIDGEDGPVAFFQSGQRIFRRTVIHGEHDDGFRFRPERQRVGTARGGFFHPAHIALTAKLQPARKPRRQVGPRIGARKADRIEACLARFRGDACLQIRVFRSRDWHRISGAACRARGRPGRRGRTAAI